LKGRDTVSPMLAQTLTLFPTFRLHDAPATAEDLAWATKKLPLRRVLIVDDEPLVRWAIAQLLNRDVYQVQEAADAGSTVRALLESAPPDVVLLDLRLPDSTDLGLLQTVRRLAPGATVILMTAFGSPDLQAEALKLGAACVLDKPFDIDRLEDLIEDLSPPR
jgi:two-component system, response regulator, stage 0 sporulation protein F